MDALDAAAARRRQQGWGLHLAKSALIGIPRLFALGLAGLIVAWLWFTWQGYFEKELLLYDSSSIGHMPTVHELIGEGTNTSWVNPVNGFSCLMIAAHRGSTKAVRALVKAKAVVHYAEPQYGSNALHHASGQGHAETVRVLINEGGAMAPRSARRLGRALSTLSRVPSDRAGRRG